jgi:KDO2-lipid IV(A) lauroyltransferase
MFARLPLPVLYRLGGLGGWFVYLCSPTFRRHLRANLTQAVGTPSRALLHAAVAETGRQVLEACWVWLRPIEEQLTKIKAIYGQEVVEAARRDGKAILFLTPHLGCFEMAGHISAQIGAMPLTVMYRPPRYRALESLMQMGRVRGQVFTAPANMAGVRQLLKALRAREMVGILPDQVPRAGEGVWADFFGRPAWTMTLATRLAETRHTQMLYLWVERLPRGEGYTMHFSRPSETYTGDLAARCAAMNRDIERLILQRPEQYLWGYNRYKHRRGVPMPPKTPEKPSGQEEIAP